MGKNGRLSLACSPCREKRRKCDRSEPGCGQCKRQSIECFGYRKAGELRLLDETDRLTQSLKPSTGSFEVQLVDRPKRRSSPRELPAQISIKPTELATTYFMGSYIMTTTLGMYLPKQFLDGPATDDALTSAVKAVAMAAYSRMAGNAQTMLDMGCREYTVALRRTNEMLPQARGGMLDRALATVLTLSLFESLVFKGQKEVSNWLAHTHGTVALLRMRGAQHMSSESWYLSVHAGYAIRLSCIWRRVEVPADLVALEEAYGLSRPNDPDLWIFSFMNKLASCMVRLYDQDLSFADDMLRLETEGRYGTSVEVLGSEGSGDHFDLLRLTKRWCVLIVLRMLLLECLGVRVDRKYLLPRFTKITEDIVHKLPKAVPLRNPDGKFLLTSRCYAGPLAFVGSSPFASPAQKEWAANQLQQLAYDADLPQVANMAAERSQTRGKGFWVSIYHLL